jgi:DNA-binding SARP family transcriptional activator
MLAILLLGPPQILAAGAPVELPRRRARALVYYLAAQPAPVRREQLIGLLWPDHERGAAQQTLRSTLHGVRRALGSILLGEEALTVAPTADVDHRGLLAAVNDPWASDGELGAALARWRGEFLAGFELPDAEPFAEWLAAERERSRLLVTRGLARLARLREERADYASALDALRQALGFDPLQEDLQRDAIRLHYLAGDRVGAIRRYEQLRELLDSELGVPPMRETQELYDAIVTDSLELDARTGKRGDAETGGRGNIGATDERRPTADTRLPAGSRRLLLSPQPSTFSPQPSPALPFTGRDEELGRLAAATAAGRLALIEGETGIGKTRLAEEFVARSQREGGLALLGMARELEQSIPYSPIVEALRALAARPEWPELRASLGLEPLWLREASRLLPELAAPGEIATQAFQPDEVRLWESVARLLIALAGRMPLTLVLDDLHWADASSLGLLGYLLRRAEGVRLQLVATARPTPPRGPLATLLATLTREGRLERVQLRRLNAAETEALARALSPAAADELAAWLQRNAEGNPYILGELVRFARSEGLLSADGRLNSEAMSAAPVVPQSVYSLIEARLARLPDDARRVLDAAVAAGRSFEFEVVARAAALSEAAALDALDELREARIVEPLPDGTFRFDHTLTMEVAYREVGEPRHRMLHRRVGEALELLHRERLDEVAGLIASHFAEGGAHERAAIYARRAGRRAAEVAAWAEAIAFYEQALAAASTADRPAILAALGDALFLGGETVRAAERYREVLQLTRTGTEATEARINLARSLIPQGRYAEVIELIRALEPATAEERWAALFIWGTALSVEGSDLAEAALRLRTAERLLADQPVPDPLAMAQVRFELGSVAAQQGDLPRAVAYYHEALVVADGAADMPTMVEGALTWRILARNNLAYHLLLLGDLPSAARYAAEGVRLAEERGAIGLQPYLQSTSGEIALANGDLDGAEQWFAAGLALAERLPIPERVAGITANLGLVALRRGQTTVAIHRLSAALARADALGTRHLAAQVRLWLAPLLPANEARATLAEAKALAESGNRRRLLAEIARLEDELKSL